MDNKVIIFNKKQLILFAVGLILITALVSILTSRVDTPVSSVDPYQQKLDSLNIEINHIRDKQFILGNQIKRYKDSLKSSNIRIDSLGKELIQTRIYYGKKIKDISNYNPTELFNFFTERYK